MHVARSSLGLEAQWRPRGNVIPAFAEIQNRGADWIPACAGMTTTLRARSISTPEYITTLGEESGNAPWGR
jgi:hypothetical protein